MNNYQSQQNSSQYGQNNYASTQDSLGLENGQNVLSQQKDSQGLETSQNGVFEMQNHGQTQHMGVSFQAQSLQENSFQNSSYQQFTVAEDLQVANKQNQQKSQDDAVLIEEIEKTIQGLLNLNLLGSLSEDTSSVGQEDGACTGGTKGNKNVSNSTNCSEESNSNKTADKDEKSSTGSFQNQQDDGGNDLSRQFFIEDCAKRIVERISQVRDMDTLHNDMHQYLNEYTGEYDRKFKSKQSGRTQMEKDNKILKKAVKILYGKIQEKRKTDTNARQSEEQIQALISQNQNLHSLVRQKDIQIQALQNKLQEMMLFCQQNPAFNNHQHTNGSYQDPSSGNQGFGRDYGDTF